MNKSIILLSGGLDSVVSLACAKEKYNITMAITFDYSQRSKELEIKTSKEICDYYKLEHKVITVPWLADITQTSLVNKSEKLPEIGIENLDNFEIAEQTAKKVWVPNRNGLFINIAGCFADSMDFSHIIFGANKEEATTFSDNSAEFIEKINKSLEYSTLVHPKVFAPLVEYSKTEIVKIGIEKKAPFNLIRSCYTENIKHCGKCESCLRLKRAILEIGNTDLIEVLFEKSE